MSDNYFDKAQHSTDHSGLIEVEATEALKRAYLILGGISGGAKKAVGSAISRAAASGKTEVKRLITQEYTINQSTFLHETKNINHYKKNSDGDIEVVFGFRGYTINLMKFNTKVGNDGLVHTQVKRSNSGDVLKHAFPANMGGHSTRIYERIGKSRYPVKALHGPSTPQMIYSNEVIEDKMTDKIYEVFTNRVEHEITRLLAGIGG